MQSQMMSKMMPMMVSAMSTHHPVRSMSCSRRTAIASPGSSNASETSGPTRPVSLSTSATSMIPPAEVRRNANSAQYQNSERAARPENVA
jgi:hypothetical protein